mgnify:CR=1 FL=1|jgi:hypothetical protein
MKKGILVGIVVILLAVVGGGVYVFLNAGDLIKQVVEEVGSKATKTKVTLSKVDLSIQTGEAALKGFRMGNPAGFKTDKAMSFGAVSVKIDTDSVTKDVIVVKEVVISSPDITYEYADGKANFDVIQKNVEAFAKEMGAGGKKGAKDDKGGKKLIINHLYVRDGKVAISAGLLAGKKITVPLPTIHLKDIGKKEKGATAGEVASQVMSSISSKISGVGKVGMDSAVKAVKGAVDGAKKMLEGGADGAGKVMEDTTKSIKGLFGK